jgi:uncharacterized protein (TIGR00725 family)
VTTGRRRTVAVVGPGEPDDDALLADAYEVGVALARAGCVVVTGGLGGVMAAASRGAHDAGGMVIGLLPGDERDTANEWVDVVIPTGLGEIRNALVVAAAEVVIAVGGSWGTLAEIALARRRGVPVLALGGWQVVGPAPDDGVTDVSGPKEAAEQAKRLLG